MKKAFKMSLALSIVVLMITTSFSSYAGWDYKSEISIDRMEGRVYIVTHCEDKLGDDCNMVGSASRIDITLLMDMLRRLRR